MFWKAFKFFLSAICLSLVVAIFSASPHLGIADIAFASLFIFLAAGLWINYTKPQDSQNLTAVQRNLAKGIIWGLVIIFISIFITAFAVSDGRFINPSSLIKIISALLKAL